MNDVMISTLRSYWERLRAGRIAPYRAEVDPRQFESALENMFILERMSPDNLRIRLAGMKICEMMGMEVRGMQAGELIDAPDRVRFERLLNVVLNEPATVDLRLEARGRAGVHRAAMLLMPLRSDFGDMNRILGCASGGNEFFAPPLAFGIHEVTVSPIETSGVAEGGRRLMPGFAEEAQSFTGAPRGPALRAIDGNPDAPVLPPRGRPKLRLVDSD